MERVYEVYGNGHSVEDIIRFMKSPLRTRCLLKGMYKGMYNGDSPIVVEVFNYKQVLQVQIYWEDGGHLITALDVPKDLFAIFLIDGEPFVFSNHRVSKNLSGITVTDMKG